MQRELESQPVRENVRVTMECPDCGLEREQRCRKMEMVDGDNGVSHGFYFVGYRDDENVFDDGEPFCPQCGAGSPLIPC